MAHACKPSTLRRCNVDRAEDRHDSKSVCGRRPPGKC
jgi:hypothetical protein